MQYARNSPCVYNSSTPTFDKDRLMTVFGRRLFLSTLGFASLALAAAPCRSQAAADPAILTPVNALIETLLIVMKQGQTAPFASRVTTLAPVIDRSFDLDAILRASAGSGFSALDAAQQDALRAAFRDYTIASYVHSFNNFNGQRFEVQPDTRPIANGEQVVQTRMITTSGEPHALDYVMRARGNTWQVVDVLADGSVSRVAVQRSDFRRLLEEGGAPALIGSLRAKVQELATP
jgi:phospholipid transport system substrate-binding protein